MCMSGFKFVIIVRLDESCMIFKIIDLINRESTSHMSVIENDLEIEVVVEYMTVFTAVWGHSAIEQWQVLTLTTCGKQ